MTTTEQRPAPRQQPLELNPVASAGARPPTNQPHPAAQPFLKCHTEERTTTYLHLERLQNVEITEDAYGQDYKDYEPYDQPRCSHARHRPPDHLECRIKATMKPLRGDREPVTYCLYVHRYQLGQLVHNPYYRPNRAFTS